MLAVVNAFDAMPAEALAAALEQAAPITTAAAEQAAQGVSTGGMNNVASRLAAVRGDTQMASTGFGTGLAAGNPGMSRHFWMRGFGNWGQADRRDGFDGYKTDMGGLSVGADTQTAAGWRVGGALTYAATTLDHQGANAGDHNKIDSYQLTGYAMKDFGPSYVDLMLSYARHDNDTRRTTALGRTATGNFDSNQWSARVAGGHRIPMQGKTVFTPIASLEWSNLEQEAYTETGAGALNLSYNSQQWDSWRLGVGARISGETTWGATKVLPEAHVMVFHELGDRRVDTTARFTGGGAAFTTPGQTIERNSYNLGLGMAFLTGKTSRVTLGYDYEGRSGFDGHSLQLTGRWAF